MTGEEIAKGWQSWRRCPGRPTHQEGDLGTWRGPEAECKGPFSLLPRTLTQKALRAHLCMGRKERGRELTATSWHISLVTHAHSLLEKA